MINTSMNQKVTAVQINATLHPEEVLVFAFYLNPKHPYHVSHPIDCPFDYLYALKPKNPV